MTYLKRIIVLCAAVAVACSKSTSPIAPTPPPPAPSGEKVVVAPPPPAAAMVNNGILVGTGDIGFCGTGGAEATARLLDRIPGTVFTTGDNAYMSGTADEYRRCYDPSWGRHRARTRPVAGNHEYESGGAGYFEYFGANAGGGDGYYSYPVGSWNVVALNSEVASGPGSPQMAWLQGELAANRASCTAVLWHRPLFSSGRNGNNPDMRGVWRTLYDANVDLIINGHDHTYERFAPQDPDGRPDSARGIRQFVVGTGGAPVYGFPTLRANSEVRGAAWGVAVFKLGSGRFDWEFVPVDGESFRDSGSQACH